MKTIHVDWYQNYPHSFIEINGSLEWERVDFYPSNKGKYMLVGILEIQEDEI